MSASRDVGQLSPVLWFNTVHDAIIVLRSVKPGLPKGNRSDLNAADFTPLETALISALTRFALFGPISPHTRIGKKQNTESSEIVPHGIVWRVRQAKLTLFAGTKKTP